MAKFLVHGGKKLHGSIAVSSSKNATMGILCGAVMVRNTVILKDVPRIQEVDRMLELLESIGVTYAWKDTTTLHLDSSNTLTLANIDKDACTRTRSSIMLLGALANQATSYRLYKTGGCKLGERTVRPHMYALNTFGVSVTSRDTHYEVKNTAVKAADIVMYESGDTPTENAIMAAVLAPGKTTIAFASSNYMVQDLCYFLVQAGAKIEGI
ncbi:MAG: UDP-N-acetylglucosamine 1-carboxyvinyltransferase, partial [Candidatus Magasanikbacteria bacterium CG10_big_fil_rev_8_21_14_0_10_43_6]